MSGSRLNDFSRPKTDEILARIRPMPEHLVYRLERARRSLRRARRDLELHPGEPLFLENVEILERQLERVTASVNADLERRGKS